MHSSDIFVFSYCNSEISEYNDRRQEAIASGKHDVDRVDRKAETMKREERNLWYSLRRDVTEDTISVEIPVNYSREGRQGIHDLLTIEKHMQAVSIIYNDIMDSDCILYVQSSSTEQEGADIDDIMNTLPRRNYNAIGNKRERKAAETAAENMEGKKTMGKFEKDSARVHKLLDLQKERELTAAERAELLQIYRMAYHDSGKIEGCWSADASAHGCEFCEKMRHAAELQQDIICGKCYDYKQECYRTNVRNRHELNLLIMKSVLFTVDELRALPSGELLRINSSGDIDNVTQARNMIRLAIAHAFSHVGFWSKNDVIMTKAFDMEGKPANVVYVQSSPRINHRVNRGKYADYTFTVYDAEHIADAIASGSMECNGKKCKDCGYCCYYGAWPAGADIAELLRK